MPKSTPHSESMFGTEPRYLPKSEEDDRLYYLLMGLIVVGLIAGIVLVGGMVRVTMAIFILLLIGFNLIYWVVEDTENPDIWKRESEYHEEVNLKLRGTSELVQRAFKGMELSQGYLEKKIKDLFLDKLMDKRNISQDELRELMRDPEGFRDVVDDKVISDFILYKKEESEKSFEKRLKEKEYEELISELLTKIEEWE